MCAKIIELSYFAILRFTLTLSLALALLSPCQESVEIIQTCFAMYVAALQSKIKDDQSHQI